MDKVWCSEPLPAVMVNSGERVMTAYTVEFHSDGTATVVTYMGSCPSYEEIEPEDMEIQKSETVSWEISSGRTIEFDGTEYKYSAEDGWYISDGCLHLNKTYYENDEWDYVED